MKNKQDPRHTSRILVLQKLFENSFKLLNLKDRNNKSFSSDKLCEINNIKHYNKKLFENLFKSVEENKKITDQIISELAPERPIDEISQIDLQILRIAITEGFIEQITPYKVAIDEAIELAKEFGGLTSSRFVNGVLGNLLNKKEEFNL